MEHKPEVSVLSKLDEHSYTTDQFLRLWNTLGLSPALLIAMVKGALPASIAIAASQSDAWAKEFGTLGYLTSTMALLGLALQPRAKFLQTMTLNVVFICFGAAIGLLQMNVTVAARKSTSGPQSTWATAVGSSGTLEALEYNASANAVAGLGLFIQVYLMNTVRAFRPQLNIACIAYAIFTTVSSTYAPSFPDMAVCKAFTKQLLAAALTGLALATGVSLLIFPTTLRSSVGKMNAGFFKLTSAFIAALGECLSKPNLSGVPPEDHRGLLPPWQEGDVDAQSRVEKSLEMNTHPTGFQQTETLKALLKQLGDLFGKIQSGIGPASQELAYGKMRTDDLLHINDLLRKLLIPTIGISTAVELVDSHGSTATSGSSGEQDEQSHHQYLDRVSEIFMDQVQQLKRPLQGGLLHIQLLLELAPRSKKGPQDVEAKGDAPPSPGSPDFVASFADRLSVLSAQRKQMMQKWWKQRCKGSTTSQSTASDTERGQPSACGNTQDLHVMLYLDFMMSSLGTSILNVAKWADSKHKDGTMSKKCIVSSLWGQARAILKSAILQDNPASGNGLGGHKAWRKAGCSLAKKDPEHLPPATMFERSTNHLRLVPALLRSRESAFGFRAAVATLSIGILAFLEQTRNFFLTQRLQWALFMIAISMSLDAGQSVSQFALRIAGTIMAICSTLIIWYICDEKTGAIIPVLFLYLTTMFYFVIKYPQYLRAAIISIMSAILIIGYELQVRKLGLAGSTQGGQPAYPIYELAPYRLACVAGGLLVAFFWVYFPYPVQTQSLLRQDLATALHLLAELHAAVQADIQPRLRTSVMNDEHVQGRAATRRRLFSELSILMPAIRERAQFTRFGLTFGGRFPGERYSELVKFVQKMFYHIMLMAYASAQLQNGNSELQIQVLDATGEGNKSNAMDPSSILSLLSASLTSGYTFPSRVCVDAAPFGHEVPIALDNLKDPALPAFAVVKVCGVLFQRELGHAVDCVKDLVGESKFA